MENLVSTDQLQSWYKGKKVFVTGHTGFKGAWLSAWLHLLGATVKGYALEPDYENGLFDLLRPLKITDSVIADIRDKDRLEKELLAFSPDFVFHLAAQPLVRRSYEIPAETFSINTTGTANLLEAVHRLDKPCTVILITTDKVYENKERQDLLYKEEDSLGGYDPYSASKACAELVANAFRSSFFPFSRLGAHGKTLATARAGNVIGGGDWSKDRIIPDIVRALQESRPVEVRNPSAVRPWQHVLEPIGGYLLLGGYLHDQPKGFSKAYNFGPLPGDHLSVKELVETALAVWGSGTWKDISDPGQVHEAVMLKLDIGRARKELSWEPRLTAQQAVEWALQWYRQPLSARAAFTLLQIKDYLSL